MPFSRLKKRCEKTRKVGLRFGGLSVLISDRYEAVDGPSSIFLTSERKATLTKTIKLILQKMSSKANTRISFSSITHKMEYPDFLEVQLKSFQDFFQLDTTAENRKNEGLYKVFTENFPITDTRNNFVLEFIDYYVDPPRYSIDECLEMGLTYSVPLKAKLRLSCTDPEHEDFDTVIQDVYFGTIPYMTPRGTFVINGAERVVVSQLHRSPGVFFGQSVHTNGTKLYSARIIPFKGSLPTSTT